MIFSKILDRHWLLLNKLPLKKPLLQLYSGFFISIKLPDVIKTVIINHKLLSMLVFLNMEEMRRAKWDIWTGTFPWWNF